ncbi:unnamed protein product [Urochloa decumbens]|uniref:Uncharacterized protein n=1 Tax=Urochloa decumbens TaxID=240449 RepID=A0ABC8YGY8_9POAL
MPAPAFTSANVGAAVDDDSYVLHVDHYWHAKQLHRNGQRITSPSIKAAGCSWRIHYYPNGISSACKEYISISVALEGLNSRVSEPIKACWSRFTLLDQDREPVAGHSVYTDWDMFVDRAASLSDDMLGTDVVFQVGGVEFSVHRSVLAARSPVFEAELSSATREGSTAARDCIRIDDMLPEVFESLLHFAYSDSLPDMDGPQGPMIAEHLLVAADRFGMQELKLICEKKLGSNINEDTIANMLRFAEQHQCRFLRDACIEFLEDPPVLQVVMATDDDLLELVAKSCPVLLKELWANDEDDTMLDELATMCS